MKINTFLECFIVFCIIAQCPANSQTIYRVPSEYPTIQAAVDQVGSQQDIVLIAPGIYTGEGNRDITIDGKNVTIKGDGDPEEIIIDAGGSEGNIHNIFNLTGYSSYMFQVRNVTLRGAWGKSCIHSSHMYVVIDSCIIRSNEMAERGGGVFSTGAMLIGINSIFHNNNSVADGGSIRSEFISLTGCQIKDSSASSGGGLSSLGYAEIDNCVFSGNSALWYGGGMAFSATTNISHSVFEGNASENYGGGCWGYNGNCINIDSCLFQDNSAPQGGGIELYDWIDCSITNSLFIDNDASYRGGGASIGGIFWTQFINNIVCGNHAAVGGGGLLLDITHEINIVNSIIWNNSAPKGQEINMFDSQHTGWEADANVSYSIVEEAETLVEGDNHHLNFGVGIIPEDPGFMDPASGDYCLSWNSVGIDNGTSEAAPETDAFGLPRPVGPGVDIGACEFQIAQDIGAHLFMPNTVLTAGDTFSLEMLNVTGTWHDPVDMVIILDVQGTLFFYPDWQSGYSSSNKTVEYGRSWNEILSFSWPEGIGSGGGLRFWGAILNPQTSSVIGEIDVIPWSYY